MNQLNIVYCYRLCYPTVQVNEKVVLTYTKMWMTLKKIPYLDKAVVKDNIMRDSIYKKIPEQAYMYMLVVAASERVQGLNSKVYDVLFLGDENVLKSDYHNKSIML